MKIQIEDLFKNSFVINVSDEQFNRFTKIFSYHRLTLPQRHLGIKFTNTTFHTFKLGKKPSASIMKLLRYVGVSSSHIEIIKFAKYLDLPFVCVFEDDAYPCFQVKEKMQLYLDDIPENADAVIFGKIWYDKWNVEDVGTFMKIRQPSGKTCYGSHAYIIFKKAYDRYLDIVNTKDFICDHAYTLLDNVYLTKEDLFIQYQPEKSNSNHFGYWSLILTDDQIKERFPRIEKIIK